MVIIAIQPVKHTVWKRTTLVTVGLETVHRYFALVPSLCVNENENKLDTMNILYITIITLCMKTNPVELNVYINECSNFLIYTRT